MYLCNNFVSSDNEIVPLHTVWTVNGALNCVAIVQTFFAQKIFLFLQGSSSHSCPGWMGYRKNFFMAKSPKFKFQLSQIFLSLHLLVTKNEILNLFAYFFCCCCNSKKKRKPCLFSFRVVTATNKKTINLVFVICFLFSHRRMQRKK